MYVLIGFKVMFEFFKTKRVTTPLRLNEPPISIPYIIFNNNSGILESVPPNAKSNINVIPILIMDIIIRFFMCLFFIVIFFTKLLIIF